MSDSKFDVIIIGAGIVSNLLTDFEEEYKKYKSEHADLSMVLLNKAYL